MLDTRYLILETPRETWGKYNDNNPQAGLGANQNRLFNVFKWVGEACFGEAFESQAAGVTFSAAPALPVRVVTTVRQRIVNAELDTPSDDLGFCEVDDGRVDFEAAFVFDGSGGGKIGHVLKGFDIVGSAIRVSAVVGCVDADEDVEGAEDLGPGQRVA